MFGIGTLTYLLSKEIYVLEHNFYNGISLFIIVAVLHNKLGPAIAAWADKGIEVSPPERNIIQSMKAIKALSVTLFLFSRNGLKRLVKRSQQRKLLCNLKLKTLRLTTGN